ncbi:MAG: helix-turn-helix domain-containing protein [Lachnospiraceae bacterium]|nr:helix-turn-helix domain-containing protein [Lachnospiraceae bacterium]
MKIKSKDIAKELHLSEATVSLVLNDRPGVSEATRKGFDTY